MAAYGTSIVIILGTNSELKSEEMTAVRSLRMINATCIPLQSPDMALNSSTNDSAHFF